MNAGAGLWPLAVARMSEAKCGSAAKKTAIPDFALRAHPGFCNGRGLVNPFLLSPIAGNVLLYGVGARPPPDGLRRGKVGPIYGCVIDVDIPDGGLTCSIVPARGLRFGKAGVVTRPKNWSPC